MEIYLVGGAVRDRLLGGDAKDRDWVVVGATPEQMTALGYRQVGKDFPVFLHPETREEYALARTERKTAPGYHGFEVHASPEVTLEEDLQRRDLTINALAEDSDGNIIDHCHGLEDLDNRILRHVSPAFAEDPVRILRVARFAARYAHLGFRVADETIVLMRNMVANGEVDALVAERIRQELEKALATPTPSVFFEVLRECGALAVIFPEVDQLFGVPQPAEHHPEIDAGVHTMMVLEQAAKLSENPMVRFAALTHDLGKGVTPADVLPKHHGHERAGLPLVKELCRRLKTPKAWLELAVVTAKFHTHVHRAQELKPKTILKTLEDLGAFRVEGRLEQFLICCEADARGRKGREDRDYPQAEIFRNAFQKVKEVSPRDVIAAFEAKTGKRPHGELTKNLIHQARIAAIR